MYTLEFNMYQTLAIAVVMLYVGTILKRRIQFLETFCIPSPVVGGLLFAIISCCLYTSGIIGFSFDETLKTVCMVAFFTSVGFQANISFEKRRHQPVNFLRLCLRVDFLSELFGDCFIGSFKYQPIYRTLHGFNFYGRRSRHSRSFWPGT